MPAPIVYQKDAALVQGIQGAGSAFAQALQMRNMEKKEEQKEEKKRAALTSFSDVLGNSQGMQPASISQAYQQAIQQGADPTAAANMAALYKNQLQQNAFSSAMDAALSIDGGITSDAGRQEFLKAYAKNGGDFKDVARMFETPKAGSVKQTPFDKKVDEFKANSVLDLVKGGGKSTKIAENLNWLQDNLSKVGKFNAVTGLNYGPLQSETFAEYQNRGNLVLSSVIDIYNKSGVLPQRKLEWLRDQFAISPYDTQAVIQGKLNALMPLVSNAVEFEAKLGDLVEQYGADIPNQEFLKLVQKLDQATDEGFKETNQRKLFDKPPEPSSMKKGTILSNPETGKKIINNGSRWVEYEG